MKNNLCVSCDGRGFHWAKGYIINHDNKAIADTYKQGSTCRECGGTGEQPKVDGAWWLIAIFLAMAAFTFFVFIPLVRMLF